MRKIGTLVALLLLLSSGGKTLPLKNDGSSEESSDEIDERANVSYRLSNNAVPTHYNIKLIPDLENFTFDGEISVYLTIHNATKLLDLHTSDLTWDEAATYLESKDGRRYEPIDFTYVNVTQIMTVTFDKILPSGVYNFHNKFTGILNDELCGFYRSSYKNDDNETVWLATTQFEATYARKAFPCWDEPTLKATFNISMKHYPNYTALSNMPAYEQSEIDRSDGKVWTHFQKTPVMSTYIIAFVLSDFVAVPNADSTINVWTRRNAISGIGFGHEVAQKASVLLEKYTNSTVRVPKMDHVLIPDYYEGHGAMENWGLVTYEESSFLYYPNKTNQESKGWAAMIIAHELTHQWFGNVVSPTWWDHVWLNEGFAAYFQYYITDKIFPSWRLMDLFVPRVLQLSFSFETYPNAEPISHNVSSPKNIEKTFSALTYLKTPSVLRMLAHVVTDKVFRLGLIKYLQKYQYSNALPDDLWSQIQDAVDEGLDISHEDFRVKEMMDTWIYQKGYPLVTVYRNYNNGEVTITQEPFNSSLDSNEDEDATEYDDDASNRWWIPINYATRTKANFSCTLPTHWLKPQNENITINDIDANDWLILNVQQTGHYRINYDERNWIKLAEYLNSPEYEKIHVLNRAQIVHDSYYMMMKNKLNMTIFLDLINYLSRETDFVVWEMALDFLSFELGSCLSINEVRRVIAPYIRDLMSAVIDTVNFHVSYEDDYLTQMKMLTIREKACYLDHFDCKIKANAELVTFLESPYKETYPSYQTKWFFCDGLSYANESIWDKMMEMYLNDKNVQIMKYLACVRNITLVEKYLNMTITEDSPFYDKDYKKIFQYLFYEHPTVADVATDFAIKYWDEIVPRNDTMKNSLAMLMIYSATSRDRLQEIKLFLEDKDTKNLSRRIEKEEKTQAGCERFLDTFRAWQNSKETNSV